MRVAINIYIMASIFSFAYPCDCAPPSPEEAYIMVDAVFSGQVTEIVEDWTNLNIAITLDVFNVWKGSLDDPITILTGIDDGICGYNFQLDQEYLIYGYFSGIFLWTNICTRTNLLFNAEEDLNYLNSLNLCSEGECGPPLGMPNYLCSDGITFCCMFLREM